MFKAVQAGADAHAVPSARRETRVCRCEPAAWRGEKGKGRLRGWGGGRAGAGVALHASRSIRASRVCPVHVDVSLIGSVAGERLELPRA